MNKQVAIPKTSVIELRQQNSNAVVKDNGDFSVNLDKQLILEEGDSIQLKSVYLDTGSVESGFIDLPPDATQADPKNPVTTITITVGKYVMNVPSSQEGEFYTTNIADKAIVQSKIRNPQITDGQEQGNGFSNRIRANTDGKPYVMCSQTQNSAGADTQFSVDEFIIDITGGKGSLLSEALNFTMEYQLPNLPVTPANRKKKSYNINMGNAFATKTQTIAQVQAAFFQLAFYPSRPEEQNGTRLFFTQALIDTFPNICQDSADFGFMTAVATNQGTIANGTAASLTRNKVKDPSKPFPYVATAGNPATTAVDPNQLHLTPITEDITFTLPSARYTSSEIAKRITQEASRINQVGEIDKEIFSSTNSSVYRTIQDETRLLNPTFSPRADDATAHALLTNGKIVFVETDIPEGQTFRNTFRFNSYKTTDRNYMVGSSGGFTLEYDDASSKFSISNMHSPLRDQNPDSNAIGAPQIRGYSQPLSNDLFQPTNNNRKFYVNKYSGIYIQDLQPRNVWNTQMKFDSSLFPSSKNSGVKYKIGKPPEGGRPDNREEFSMDHDLVVLTDGTNTTGTYESVGTAEQHGISTTEQGGGGAAAGVKRITADTSTFDTIIEFLPATEAAQNVSDEVLTPVPYLATNTDQVFNIFSNQQVDDGQHDVADEGYYKIVVDSKIDNELVGANQTIRNVSAIISKYNSYGNFTAAYNEGSVSYIHKGQPLTITDFRVKILLPNGELATDINDRNTVFLELTKNQ